jgi:antitoxin component YwqK of YwqJK toxin-antitoxin module
MKNVIILVIAVVFCLFSCSKPKLSEVKITDDSGKVLELYSIDLETKMKQGSYTTFYPSGTISSVSNYVNDTLEGKKVWYFENGKTETEENFIRGAYEGAFKAYFEDGSKLQEGQFKNNMPSGLWLTYYANGNLKEQVSLIEGKENGPFEEYTEDGIIKTKGIYKNGPKEDGLLELFDTSGELVKKMLCKNGICQTSWTKQDGEKQIDETLFEILE